MTTIVEALNRIARQCSIGAPSSWVNATRADHVELRDDFLQETLSDIADRIDLPAPFAGRFAFPGTGAETYALPADFKRLQRHENTVYDVSQDRPCVPITRDGDWEFIKDTGTAGVVRYYRLAGYDGNWTISLYNEPTAAIETVISYMTTSWMASAAGVVGDEFTSETDVLILPRTVVESGTVWRYRERRGLPYLDKYNEYEAKLARLSNDTRARRVVSFGETDNNVRWQDLVPAFIPSS